MTKILYFSASWCGPCKATYPILQQSAEKAGVFLHKIDIDEEPEQAAYYGICQVPTIIKITDECEVARLYGAQNKWTLEKFVSEA